MKRWRVSSLEDGRIFFVYCETVHDAGEAVSNFIGGKDHHFTFVEVGSFADGILTIPASEAAAVQDSLICNNPPKPRKSKQ